MYSWTKHNIFYEMHKELLSSKKCIWLQWSRAFPKAEKSLQQLNLRPREEQDSYQSIRPLTRVGIPVRGSLWLTVYCALLEYSRKGAANYLQLSLGDSAQVLDNLLHTSLRICYIFLTVN